MRKKDVYFFERQHFRQWWLWVMLIGVNLLFAGGFIQQIIFDKPFGDNPMSNVGLIITMAIVLLTTIPFFSGSLQTFINKEGVYVKFTPFLFRFKFYDWNDINSISIERYNPISEFGGWGIRVGRKGAKAYSMSGKEALKLNLKNKKTIVIGTRQPDYLKKIVMELGKMEHKNDG